MNDRKLQKLFEAARNERAPEAAADFPSSVLRGVRSQTPLPSFTVLDSLAALFPRTGLAAAAMIAICILVYASLSLGPNQLVAGATELSQQWLFGTKGF